MRTMYAPDPTRERSLPSLEPGIFSSILSAISEFDSPSSLILNRLQKYLLLLWSLFWVILILIPSFLSSSTHPMFDGQTPAARTGAAESFRRYRRPEVAVCSRYHLGWGGRSASYPIT